MSSDKMTDDESSSRFETELQDMYEQYRRKRLKSKLDELAETMEATILQCGLAQSFFDADVAIDESAKGEVQATLELLERSEYDTVENRLPSLETAVEDEATSVQNRVQELRLQRLSTVQAMNRLNNRVDRADSAQLTALESLLEDWNWRPQVYTDEAETLAERRTAAREYGTEMDEVYDELKDDLFGTYEGTELRPLVDSLLDDDRLTLAKLSEAEIEQLAESDLAEYVELSLS